MKEGRLFNAMASTLTDHAILLLYLIIEKVMVIYYINTGIVVLLERVSLIFISA